MRKFSLRFNFLLKSKIMLTFKGIAKLRSIFNLITINIYYCLFEIIYLHCQDLYHLSEKNLLKYC
jgi:hypothetical protein